MNGPQGPGGAGDESGRARTMAAHPSTGSIDISGTEELSRPIPAPRTATTAVVVPAMQNASSSRARFVLWLALAGLTITSALLFTGAWDLLWAFPAFIAAALSLAAGISLVDLVVRTRRCKGRGGAKTPLAPGQRTGRLVLVAAWALTAAGLVLGAFTIASSIVL